VAQEQPIDVTHLLREMADGRTDAEAQLIPLVYRELHRIAHYLMRREGDQLTLQTTALVHEAYLRLLRPQAAWEDRIHFFRVAATVMRRILVDHARARQAEKRGGGAGAIKDVFAEPFDRSNTPDNADRILAVDEALTRLAAVDERQAQIVELRFFVGMTVEETAELLALSPRTVKREWQLARAWLANELGR
jgi:RNA polymerase sigma factor (TIGR02999 family)